MISLEAVHRHFVVGEQVVHAVSDASLSIAAGEFVALAGPSGSGKSTLLNLIGGLDRPSAGEITIDGRDLARLSSDELARYRRETVGFVFQAFRLLTDLTALENAALPFVLSGRSHDEAEERARPLLDAVGLAARMSHRPTQLSVGEQQRVALARALCNRPRILLADEPTANLDADAAASLLALIDELRQQHGLTVIIATHDLDLARSTQRVIQLRHGRPLDPRERQIEDRGLA